MEREDPKDDVLKNFLEIISARKLIIIIGFLSVLITSAVSIYYMPSAYRSSTRIIINMPPVPKGDSPYLADLKSSIFFVNNQKEIIQSQRIYEQVVRDLHLQDVLGTPSLSRRLLRKIFNINTDPFEEAMDTLYQITSVDVIRGTNMIQITAYSNSSVLSSKIANAIALTYINYINPLFSNKVQDIYKSANSDFKLAEERLRIAQDKLSEFGQRENAVSLMSIESEIAEQRKKLAEYQSQYEKTQDTIKNIENGILLIPSSSTGKASDEEGALLAPEENPAVRQLSLELKKAMDDLQNARSRYTENHPDVRRLSDRVKSLKEELSRQRKLDAPPPRRKPAAAPKPVQPNTQRVLDGLKMKEERLSEQMQEVKRNLKRLMRNAFTLANLTKEVNDREREYLMLREQLVNVRMINSDETRKEENIKVIEPARPAIYPDYKKKMTLGAIAFILSIVFSLGLAFIAEYTDDSFRNRDDAARYLNLPVLGVIPPISRKVLNGGKEY